MLRITEASPPRAITYQMAARCPARLVEPRFCVLDELQSNKMAYQPGEQIFGQGTRADLIYRVVRGTIRSCEVLRNGRRLIDAFRLPGDIFGFEIAEKREYSAEAIDHVSVLAVRRSTFMGRASADGNVSHELWLATAAELRRVQKHALLLVKNSRQRMACFLLEWYGRLGYAEVLELPMTRNDIADHLGLTVETVSRTMTEFAASGVIELKMSRDILIRDARALRGLSE
jgi:CRP/FNR family nitrogen fixation transcriptional regulator